MRGNPIVTIVCWLFYFGVTAGIILLDRNIQRNKAAAAGTVDFVDRNPANYLLLAVCCGPAPLIVYFGTTRKSVGGWLIGIVLAVAVYALMVVIALGLTFALGPPLRTDMPQF